MHLQQRHGKAQLSGDNGGLVAGARLFGELLLVVVCGSRGGGLDDMGQDCCCSGVDGVFAAAGSAGGGAGRHGGLEVDEVVDEHCGVCGK